MFYGENWSAADVDSVELRDCDNDNVLELLRYRYSDEVKLNVHTFFFFIRTFFYKKVEAKIWEWENVFILPIWANCLLNEQYKRKLKTAV